MAYQVLLGDCLEKLKELPDCSVDAVVTDPPYGLAFMGKKWDYDVPAVEVWVECLRVLKPGGHLLAFAGTRTQHRMAVRIEDAGFEIRDMIAWVYGSGFPKSLDVSKAIDKMGGVDTAAFKADLRSAVNNSGISRKDLDARCGFTMRFDTTYEDDPAGWGVSLPSPEKWIVICSVLGTDAERWQGLIDRVWRGRAGSEISANDSMAGGNYERTDKGEAVHDAARQWQGWGTALKPALEPVTVARKPLIGTVAENVLKHGTGGINVDACRVGTEGGTCRDGKADKPNDAGWENMRGHGIATLNAGRWPANVIHDGSDEVVGLFPQSKSTGGQASLGAFRNGDVYGKGRDERESRDPGFGDSGSAARFFYCAKASKADRDAGCEGLECRAAGKMVDRKEGSAGIDNPRAGAGRTSGARNFHPTVKPTALMRYLCRLVTPPGGLVLDPFMGSGSTGKGAILEGFRFIGIELDAGYFQIAKCRLEHAEQAVLAAEAVRKLPLFEGLSDA